MSRGMGSFSHGGPGVPLLLHWVDSSKNMLVQGSQ